VRSLLPYTSLCVSQVELKRSGSAKTTSKNLAPNLLSLCDTCIEQILELYCCQNTSNMAASSVDAQASTAEISAAAVKRVSRRLPLRNAAASQSEDTALPAVHFSWPIELLATQQSAEQAAAALLAAKHSSISFDLEWNVTYKAG
jgi:hypothetical protein